MYNFISIPNECVNCHSHTMFIPISCIQTCCCVYHRRVTIRSTVYWSRERKNENILRLSEQYDTLQSLRSKCVKQSENCHLDELERGVKTTFAERNRWWQWGARPIANNEHAKINSKNYGLETPSSQPPIIQNHVECRLLQLRGTLLDEGDRIQIGLHVIWNGIQTERRGRGGRVSALSLCIL